MQLEVVWYIVEALQAYKVALFGEEAEWLSGVIAVSKVKPPNSADWGPSPLVLNPRLQPTIRISLTSSQGLRRPPGVT